MVRNRQRSTTQQTWRAENMLRAIEAVKNHGMCFKTASRNYNVPRTTLKRRVLNVNKDAVGTKKVLGAYRPVFNKDQEEEILQLILDMEQRFYGFTSRDVRILAFELAEKNKIAHSFNKELQMAGEDWLVGFRRRHPQLSLRTPESTSIARAQGFNKVMVSKFFDLLKNLMHKNNYPPHRIFNVDETAVTTTQAKNSKVLALKGRRQVGAISSAERGVLCTAVICMAAGGNFVPPMVIFPRKRMKIELTDGAPPSCTFACSDSGWMKLHIFEQWFDHFISFEKPTKEDPVLLILDGHNTHTKNLAVIKKARENNVEILCLPPHCSHKLQPLDVSFNFPLNTYYVQSIEKFLRQNPGRVITQFQVSRLFGEAYLQASTPKTAINGFRRTGIYPCDMEIFHETEFAPSLTTDMLHVDAETVSLERNAEVLNPDEITNACSPQDSTSAGEQQIPENHILDVQPCSSKTVLTQDKQRTQQNILDEQPYSSKTILAQDKQRTQHNLLDEQPCSSKPKLAQDKQRTQQNILDEQPCSSKTILAQDKQRTQQTILDEQPCSSKTILAQDKQRTQQNLLDEQPCSSKTITSHSRTMRPFAISPREIRPLPKKSFTQPKRRKCGTTAILTSSPYKNELERELQEKEEKEKNKKKKTQSTVRNVFKDETNSMKRRIQKKPSRKSKKQKVTTSNEGSSSEDDNDNPECFYCGDTYLRSRSGDGWICCSKCKSWAHDECAGVGDEELDFECEKCL